MYDDFVITETIITWRVKLHNKLAILLSSLIVAIGALIYNVQYHAYHVLANYQLEKALYTKIIPYKFTPLLFVECALLMNA